MRAFQGLSALIYLIHLAKSTDAHPESGQLAHEKDKNNQFIEAIDHRLLQNYVNPEPTSAQLTPEPTATEQPTPEPTLAPTTPELTTKEPTSAPATPEPSATEQPTPEPTSVPTTPEPTMSEQPAPEPTFSQAKPTQEPTSTVQPTPGATSTPATHEPITTNQPSRIPSFGNLPRTPQATLVLVSLEPTRKVPSSTQHTPIVVPASTSSNTTIYSQVECEAKCIGAVEVYIYNAGYVTS
ncbi:hypothetical protein H257_09525 [Aphanomyces astaci]|nr:hypothetical protein H257_09525 [Aphanomyces astaci]ETV76520.1 hypothetical protein H257_09525 [Aphanomyces astaci]|eukprot:XP_009834065.1 hypothetical protein H257_09525 [Aphanomyces astaci]